MKKFNKYIGTEFTKEISFYFNLFENKAVLYVVHINNYKGIKHKLKPRKIITLKQKFDISLLNCPFTINEVQTTKTIHNKNYFHISDAFDVVTINQKQKVFDPIYLAKHLNRFLLYWNVNENFYFRAEQIKIQNKNVYKY